MLSVALRRAAGRTGAAHAAGRPRASQRCYASSTDVEHRVRATSVSHLDLVEIDRYLFRAPREQLWVPPGGRGVFGGQVMGQALRAATLALDGDEAWRCHSNHSYFVNACVEINQCVGCASRRWRGGRRDASARTRRKI